MKVAIVYFTLTGRTEYVAKVFSNMFKSLGHDVDLYEVRPVKEYSRRFAHLNPRIIKDTLLDKEVEIRGVEDLDPSKYDLIVVGSPIWLGRVAPPIRSFIKLFKDSIKCPIVCFTTSDLGRDYSLKFRRLIESEGLKVIANLSISDLGITEKVVLDLLRRLRLR